MSRCSCGRMYTHRGDDLCAACEQDYFDQREREKADERHQYDDYVERLYREMYEREMEETR